MEVRRGCRAPRQEQEESFVCLCETAGLVCGAATVGQECPDGIGKPWQADGAGGGGAAGSREETGL